MRSTLDLQTLELFRDHLCLTNAELKAYVGNWYRASVRRLRKRGIVINNHRLSKVIGNNEGTIYVLEKDNEQVQKIYKDGYYTITGCKPFEITEVENGVSSSYDYGFKKQSIWNDLKDFFTFY